LRKKAKRTIHSQKSSTQVKKEVKPFDTGAKLEEKTYLVCSRCAKKSKNFEKTGEGFGLALVILEIQRGLKIFLFMNPHREVPMETLKYHAGENSLYYE